MARRHLFWQLVLPNCAVSVVVMLIFGLYGAYTARNLYLGHVVLDLQGDARLVQHRVAALLAEQATDRIQAVCQETAGTLGVRITVIAPTGKVIADSDEQPSRMDNHRDRPEIVAALAGTVGRSTRYSRTLQEELMYLALPVWREGHLLGVVRTAVPVRALAETLFVLYGRIGIAAALMMGLLTVIGFWTSRRTLKPLEQIRAGAARLASGDLNHRLPVAATEEFALLAECLNRMAEQLDARIRTILCQQNEHEAMLASMEEAVLAVDNAGRILSLNETCARLLAREVTELRGRLVHEVIQKPDLLRFIDDTLASPTAVDDDLQFLGQQDRWLNAHGMALHDAEARQTGAVVVLHDVTRLRHLENLRRDFVANVSHELKTPITSIKGFVETLLDEGLEDKDNALRFLNIVLRQANRLDAIIQDLLSLSRIERGAESQSIPLEPTPLLEVLRAAGQMCEKKATDKQIAVALQCLEELSANMNAPLLEQAVVNLIDNAIKYSEPGSTVRVEAEAETEGVVIRVRDQGCGIPAKHLHRLFERFYRVDKARSRELGGTGLGLAIVKHIVMAHRGSVTVESAVGKGSRFSIHLPAIQSGVATSSL